MTTDKCFSCKRNHKSLLCKICGVGMNGEREYYTPQPITNADKIRTMTDEELADFLDRWALGDIDYSQTFCSLCKGQYDCRDDCLLGWLKQEVE